MRNKFWDVQLKEQMRTSSTARRVPSSRPILTITQCCASPLPAEAHLPTEPAQALASSCHSPSWAWLECSFSGCESCTKWNHWTREEVVVPLRQSFPVNTGRLQIAFSYFSVFFFICNLNFEQVSQELRNYSSKPAKLWYFTWRCVELSAYGSLLSFFLIFLSW